MRNSWKDLSLKNIDEHKKASCVYTHTCRATLTLPSTRLPFLSRAAFVLSITGLWVYFQFSLTLLFHFLTSRQVKNITHLHLCFLISCTGYVPEDLRERECNSRLPHIFYGVFCDDLEIMIIECLDYVFFIGGPVKVRFSWGNCRRLCWSHNVATCASSLVKIHLQPWVEVI